MLNITHLDQGILMAIKHCQWRNNSSSNIPIEVSINLEDSHEGLKKSRIELHLCNFCIALNDCGEILCSNVLDFTSKIFIGYIFTRIVLSLSFYCLLVLHFYHIIPMEEWYGYIDSIYFKEPNRGCIITTHARRPQKKGISKSIYSLHSYLGSKKLG